MQEDRARHVLAPLWPETEFVAPTPGAAGGAPEEVWRAYDQASDAVIVTAAERRCAWVNGAAARLLALAPGQIVGRRLDEFVAVPASLELLGRALLERGEQLGVMRLRAGDGSVRPVQYKARADLVLGCQVLILSSLTSPGSGPRRHQPLERELLAARSVDQLSAALARTFPARAPHARACSLLVASKSGALRAAGPSPPLLGWGEVARDADHPCALVANARVPLYLPLASLGVPGVATVPPAAAPDWLVVLPVIGRGPVRGCLVTLVERREARTLADLEGLARDLGVTLDRIRAAQRTRARVRQAEAARDEFLALAAHELDGPLAAASLLTSAIEHGADHDRDTASDSTRAKLLMLRRQLTQASALVRQLGEVVRRSARATPPRRRDCDLANLVAEVLAQRQAANPQAAPVELAVPRRGLPGRWDPEQLQQVLHNLVSNAQKFGQHRPVQVIGRNLSTGVRLRVVDQGIGIAPADHERIFERFERAVPRRQYKGLGLGLWLARQIVHAHGGHVRVDSALGEGATFEVWLPRGDSPPRKR